MTVLERAETDVEQFLYFASHDLQEPLRKVLSFSDLLVQDLGVDLNDAARKDLQYLTDAARRMQNLIQALLTYSRAGRTPLQRRSVCLRECVRRILDGMKAEIELGGAEIRLDDLPTVQGDPTMLLQIYRHLLDNALKFTNGLRPFVHFTAEQSGDEWVLGIRDNGIGIEAEKAEEIFAPFRRLHSWERYEGSGIGLAVCRTLVQGHGGRIWVESTPGVGSMFRFTLPVFTS